MATKKHVEFSCFKLNIKSSVEKGAEKNMTEYKCEQTTVIIRVFTWNMETKYYKNLQNISIG